MPGIALLPGKQEVDAAHNSELRRDLLLKDHTHRMCKITPDKIKSEATKTKGKKTKQKEHFSIFNYLNLWRVEGGGDRLEEAPLVRWGIHTGSMTAL